MSIDLKMTAANAKCASSTPKSKAKNLYSPYTIVIVKMKMKKHAQCVKITNASKLEITAMSFIHIQAQHIRIAIFSTT